MLLPITPFFALGPAMLAEEPASIVVQSPVIHAVTWANEAGDPWVPIRAVGQGLGWEVGWDDSLNQVTIGGTPVPRDSVRRLSPGAFIQISTLRDLGARVDDAGLPGKMVVVHEEESVVVKVPQQRVEINLARQQMIAWQGDVLVMSTPISSGRRGFGTPTGSFRAQSKTRHRVSRKYNNAPMPYSVHLFGGYFIHGSSSVPRSPASHGCIRVPLNGDNPASRFFQWVKVGAEIDIRRDWSADAKAVLGL
ncbi:MAG: L,D-transpeptidase family protein [Fimbriimonadaceae bacterium]|nr:L,D-transpeptidase family protein [Fimbriimonadaceae bacterium]